jgi:uncharacterized membrane protein
MTHENPNARLETLCDGVFAIASTLTLIFLSWVVFGIREMKEKE